MTMPPHVPELISLGETYLGRGHQLILMHRPTSDGGCTCGADTCKSRGKHPRFGGWNLHPIRDVVRLRASLRDNPLSNIAILAGNGIAFLDVDPRSGGDQALSQLQDRHGKLPVGPTVVTGGGGRHYYFQVEGSVRNATIAPGLELKADGMCVVAPPSLHASGKLYRWAPGRGLDIELPALPGWINEQVHSHAACSRIDTSEIYQGFAEGQRNVGMTRLAGSLIGRRVDLILACNLLIGFDATFNKRTHLRSAAFRSHCGIGLEMR